MKSTRAVRLSSLLISVILVLSLALCACSDEGEEKVTQSVPASSVATLKAPAFMHKISDNTLKEVIDAHNSTPDSVNISAKKGDIISFKAEGSPAVKNYSVARLAPVDKYEPYAELSSYTDMYLPLEYDKNTGIFSIDTDWWYRSTGWVSENTVWSHVISIECEDGNTYFYYFRVIFAQKVETTPVS